MLPILLFPSFSLSGIGRGVLVLDVPQDSPASKAGLKGTKRTGKTYDYNRTREVFKKKDLKICEKLNKVFEKVENIVKQLKSCQTSC